MLSAQAHSFRSKSRLAISLSWVAGFTNVIILILCGQTVSHMTGNSTRFGNAVGNLLLQRPGAGNELIYFGFILALFLLGAITSGAMTERSHTGRSSKYAVPITLEAVLLSVLLILLLIRPDSARDPATHRGLFFLLTGLSAFAMGLQNATITRISGAVVRTTHLTGVITDLGLELVLACNWWKASATPGNSRSLDQIPSQHNVQRVVLLASILASFMFGVTAGTVLFEKIGPAALLAPILFLSFIVLRDFFKPVALASTPSREKL